MVPINPRIKGRTVVQVFAKYPREGQVKTRLAAEIGHAMATQVHRELVERQLRQLMLLPSSIRLELWCTENADAVYYQMLFKRWPRLRYCRQSTGGLGERLDTALKRASRHADRVLQIGTDCPVLQREQILHSIHLIGLESDTVFIPAEDGGYVLAGYAALRAHMFDDIEWSTSSVLGQALRQLRKLGLSSLTLPSLWDIDHLADLRRYRALQADRAE